jgi:hypothetical protein
MEGWWPRRRDGNPRYVYGTDGRESLVLRWKVNHWVVEWYEKGDTLGLPHIRQEILPGTLLDEEAQAAAFMLWRMK